MFNYHTNIYDVTYDVKLFDVRCNAMQCSVNNVMVSRILHHFHSLNRYQLSSLLSACAVVAREEVVEECSDMLCCWVQSHTLDHIKRVNGRCEISNPGTVFTSRMKSTKKIYFVRG